MPKVLYNASLQYSEFGLPSTFHHVGNGSITSRTINNVVADLASEIVHPNRNKLYHVFHHPDSQHDEIDQLDLRPWNFTTQQYPSEYCIYFVNSSKFANGKKPVNKQFTSTRSRRLEKIVFGTTTATSTPKKLKQMLDDIASFHIIIMRKVRTLEDANPSLRSFLPRDDVSLERCRKSHFSVPINWTYFNLISFLCSFYKSGDLDESCLKICHAIGIIDIFRLTGRTSDNNTEYTVIRGKRQRNFDNNVKEKLMEMKKMKRYSPYLMQRVLISNGEEGEVLGVIDGGKDKVVNGVSSGIETFFIRFIIHRDTDEPHFESKPFGKDQVALGLVRAKNTRKGGRSKIPLDHSGWITGKIGNRLMYVNDL